MDSRTRKTDSGVIVYDADRFERQEARPSDQWFDPRWWEDRDRVVSRQRGRGTALVIETPVGRAVLRRYLRGGWPARFIHSQYFFTGYGRSRPVREFAVLEELARLELPAPRPLAAICKRHGLSYSGGLITLEITAARPLEQVLRCLDADDWRAVGTCVRRFHEKGVVHKDLTVRNILYQEGGKIFLVDFDRARFRGRGRRAFGASLQRLRRSLVKSWFEDEGDMDQKAWTHLLQGYESSAHSD